MRDEVELMRLGALVSASNEKALGRKRADWPYVGLEHLASGSALLLGTAPSSYSSSTNSVFRAGDVLFGKLRPYLRKSVGVAFDGYCSTDILVLRPCDGVDPGFAAKVLHSEPVFAEAVATSIGTKMPRTSWSALSKLRVFVPPTVEQRRIAEIIDTIDGAIRRTEQVIRKLQQMKQGLLHDLLTCGIDNSGELRSALRFPSAFIESPLGLIPKAWTIRQLHEVAVLITSGSRGWAAFYSDEGPLFIRIGNLTRDHINLRLESLMHVRPPKSSEGQRTEVREGDVLLSITADLGIVGVIPIGFSTAYVNQHIALVRLDPSQAHPRWVGHYLSGRPGRKQFDRLIGIGGGD